MENRELKFRIYSFLDKQFHYFTLEEGLPQGIAGGVSVAQQFTGLTDSKGIEIYEGSIVKNLTVDEEYGGKPAVVVYKKYEEVGWGLAYPTETTSKQLECLIHEIEGIRLIEEFPLSRFGTYEVIGDIYSTPELLTEKSS